MLNIIYFVYLINYPIIIEDRKDLVKKQRLTIL